MKTSTHDSVGRYATSEPLEAGVPKLRNTQMRMCGHSDLPHGVVAAVARGQETKSLETSRSCRTNVLFVSTNRL